MQFLYHPDAGIESIELENEEYRYITRVRRYRVGESVALRNLSDQNIYTYNIKQIDKKTALLKKIKQEHLIIAPSKYLHIGWCIIDTKKVERTLPSLNEIGVSRITFIQCARSQSNFRIDTDRLRKILINSSQQCGRSQMMEIRFSKSLEDFISDNPSTHMLNFSENKLSSQSEIETIAIGCEGGFSPDETTLFSADKTVGLGTSMILRSENAVVAVASKALL